jgi:hypothetical protein
MDLFTSPLEDEEMSLRELAMPSMEDNEMQKSDLTLATTHYEVKPSEDHVWFEDRWMVASLCDE